MNRILTTFLALIVICISINAQRPSDIIGGSSFTNEDFSDIQIYLPDHREIKSGSKFITTYSDNCPEYLRGAFEYAVKLWEEYLPESMPISISINVDDLDSNTLSYVQFKTLEFTQANKYLYPTSAVKAVIMQEYNRYGSTSRFWDEISEKSVLAKDDDIQITYNGSLLSEMYFGLDEEVVDKYDFVSLALRDIAKGLGFCTYFDFDMERYEIIMPDEAEKLTPFMAAVCHKLLLPPNRYPEFSDDIEDALKVPFSYNSTYNLYLYNPGNWQYGVSLNYTVNERNDAVERLLDYRFGKGYVMRDLSGCDWKDALACILDWRADILTGNGDDFGFTGSTDSVLPYKGNVDFSGLFPMTQQTFSSKDMDINLNLESDSNSNSIVHSPRFAEDPTLNYSEDPDKYQYRFASGAQRGLLISALLKNGQWDLLKRVVSSNSYLEGTSFNIEDLPLHYPAEDYARGTGGGLRYRVVSAIKTNTREKMKYTSYYYTRDYLPQEPRIGFSGYRNSEGARTLSDDFDEDYIFVPIDISNIEGADEILIGILEEGERYPYYFSFNDIRRGFVDVELYRHAENTISITAYNKNGGKHGKSIIIPALGYPDLEVSFSRNGNRIDVLGLPKKQLESGNIKYSLTNAVSGNLTDSEILNIDSEVEINDLASGFYILHIWDDTHINASYKFVK